MWSKLNKFLIKLGVHQRYFLADLSRFWELMFEGTNLHAVDSGFGRCNAEDNKNDEDILEFT